MPNNEMPGCVRELLEMGSASGWRQACEEFASQIDAAQEHAILGADAAKALRSIVAGLRDSAGPEPSDEQQQELFARVAKEAGRRP